MTTVRTDPLDLSLVIPCFNEEENLGLLIEAVRAAVEPLGKTFELIITDDGSTDRSWEVLKDLRRRNPWLRIQRFPSNLGQTAALEAGLRAARGRILVTFDADLQNDPRDLPRLLEALERCDCACGTRVESRRQGDSFLRVVSSRIANGVRNALSGESISDAGCCYRAFKRECIVPVKFFKGAHRFLPTLFRLEGFSVVEVPVSTHPRIHGRSKYGIWNRLFKSSRDLLAVRWMKSRYYRYKIIESSDQNGG